MCACKAFKDLSGFAYAIRHALCAHKKHVALCAHKKACKFNIAWVPLVPHCTLPKYAKKAPNESTEGGLWSEGMYWAALDGNQFHMIVGTRYSKLCSVLLKLLVLGSTPLCVAC